MGAAEIDGKPELCLEAFPFKQAQQLIIHIAKGQQMQDQSLRLTIWSDANAQPQHSISSSQYCPQPQ